MLPCSEAVRICRRSSAEHRHDAQGGIARPSLSGRCGPFVECLVIHISREAAPDPQRRNFRRDAAVVIVQQSSPAAPPHNPTGDDPCCCGGRSPLVVACGNPCRAVPRAAGACATGFIDCDVGTTCRNSPQPRPHCPHNCQSCCPRRRKPALRAPAARSRRAGPEPSKPATSAAPRSTSAMASARAPIVAGAACTVCTAWHR